MALAVSTCAVRPTAAKHGAPASIKRLPTGDLLAVWDDHTNVSADVRKRDWRAPLAAALSSDEGRTWHGTRLLEDDPKGWFCYTAILSLDDGTVLLGYCAYSGLAHTRLVKVPLNWFYGK